MKIPENALSSNLMVGRTAHIDHNTMESRLEPKSKSYMSAVVEKMLRTLALAQVNVHLLRTEPD